MSTNSTIAVQHRDGTVSQVTCHWDGAPDGVGDTLLAHYNRLNAAEALVAGGSISRLGAYLDPVGHHTFDDPEDDVTLYYARDRGERLRVNKYRNIDELVDAGATATYNYVFADGAWHVSTGRGGAYEPLEFYEERG